MTLFWTDGYNPNTSTKSNKKGAWAGSCTFILYDLQDQTVYYVNSALFTIGPKKGNKDDDHTEIFHNMVFDMKQFKDNNGRHLPVTLILDFYKRNYVRFYICPMGCLMDNPERQTNYGLLQGNSKNMEYLAYYVFLTIWLNLLKLAPNVTSII